MWDICFDWNTRYHLWLLICLLRRYHRITYYYWNTLYHWRTDQPITTHISFSAYPISKHVTLTHNLDKFTFKLWYLSYGKTDVLEDLIKQANDSYRTRRKPGISNKQVNDIYRTRQKLDYKNTQDQQNYVTLRTRVQQDVQRA